MTVSNKEKNSNPKDADMGPATSVMRRRRSGIRLVKEYVKHCEVRESFFTNRVADAWNELNEDIVAAKTVNCFKAKYDEMKKKTVLP